MKKVFVTGATGFLGAHVVIKLLKNGYFVFALVRKKSSYSGEENENLKLIEGDLFSDVSSYLEKVQFVIHIAAETSQNLISYQHYKQINYDATINLFSQVVEKKVEKFLFVSTANTLGFGSLESLGDENSIQKYPFSQSFYAKSKLEAENSLLQNNKTTDVIIINPTFMLGSLDYKPSSGKIIFWVWKKKLIFYPKGGKNFVHVEDVAKGIVNAINKGKNGEKYLLANENLKYRAFFEKVCTAANQKSVVLPIPDFVLFALGLLGDFMRFFKIKTNLSSSNMKALRIDNYYTNQKSVKDLDMTYLPTKRAISDAITFFETRK
ncbi:NAD-dependent epimerase/dehydratase family protein [Chryseobacterium sp. 3008163]|uniref:NAD-dependent epimerase/dehydratase family protein n=1 Tax=Chryseobacterium sp. 3008163 TaxID=2478663 RepID=UPI000F0D1A89|nr:NAD-dependent epimerase/dehydratase family protein [Chryseobacterium sp. 3008163]AYN02128.1 NAD-dependent epimerase/dehydratase family protein [Chryseobacterium sp. 3008163]